MAAKNTVLKRKIGTDIFEMMPKTTAGQVVVSYGDCVDLASALSKVYTDVEAWNTFKANVDFAGTDAALDTLRELIDIINKDQMRLLIVLGVNSLIPIVVLLCCHFSFLFI